MIDHTRHSGIFNVHDTRVCLVGAGGIGAITAITLGKMGVEDLWVFDSDKVEDINIATQFHRVSDIGLDKVRAVRNNAFAFAGVYPKAFCERIQPGACMLPVAGIYVSAVDSIVARQSIWQVVKQTHNHRPVSPRWYIDARMGAEVYEHFVVDMSNFDWYDSSITNASDEDMPDLPCTSKATIYTANIAAGHIGAAVRRILTWDQKPGFLHHDIIQNELYFQEISQ